MLQTRLRPAGQRTSSTVQALAPASVEELGAILAKVRREGRHVTLVGGRRSFGTHFLPPSQDGWAIDLRQLPAETELIESTEEGAWVRVSGCVTFAELLSAFPDLLPVDAPTTPNATVAGALAAACHSTNRLFCTHVRRFSLLTAQGSLVDCHSDADGIARACFDWAIGSYGALGVIVDVELWLQRRDPDRFVEVEVIERGKRSDLRRMVDILERLYQADSHPAGRALYSTGAGENLVVFGDTFRRGRRPRDRLPLVGWSEQANIAVQALSSRFPRMSQRLQPLGLSRGRRFAAEMEQFTFFQASYDAAWSTLSSSAPWARAFRALGVVPELPVVHQSFVFDPKQAAGALELFFRLLDERPHAAAQLELQDSIRLPPATKPLHPAADHPDGVVVFTPSGAARTPGQQRALVEVFHEYSRQVFEQFGGRVLLLKQVHAPKDTLRASHATAWRQLFELKSQLDPANVFRSRFLDFMAQICEP